MEEADDDDVEEGEAGVEGLLSSAPLSAMAEVSSTRLGD